MRGYQVDGFTGSQTKRYKGNSANRAVAKSCLNMPWLSSGLLALQHSMKLECGMKSITIYESLMNRLQNLTDRYLG